MQICSVVGARPQFVKAAIVSKAIADAGWQEWLVHTGQHYDTVMNQVFFDELGIPAPAVNLAVGSGAHGNQTGNMMIRLEQWLLEQPNLPDWMLIYGDTNSTLAAALVASKLHIPIAHVEAGLRSYNMQMPEEVNRIVADQLSTLCFCPSQLAVDNLKAEGLTKGVFSVGDVMLEATQRFSEAKMGMNLSAEVLNRLKDGYYLCTIHRPANTDFPNHLKAILAGLSKLDFPVLFLVHPRTKAKLKEIDQVRNIIFSPPAGYMHMLNLVLGAKAVITDSGGLQKESVWLKTPCITVRNETEWTETLAGGWNQLVPPNANAILTAVNQKPSGQIPDFGLISGRPASEHMIDILRKYHSSDNSPNS